jgi:hypothetical protein
MKFREPYLRDEKGFYVTIAQLKFFSNRYKGKDKMKILHDDFVKFLNFCKFYNYLYDCMEKDPTSAVMYWDEEEEAIGYKFPSTGKIAKAVKRYCDE